MKSKTIKYNILVFLILISILIIILESLNLIFEGVPIYRQLKIDREFQDDVLDYKREKWIKKNHTNLDKFYIDYFANTTTDEYIKKYNKDYKFSGDFYFTQGTDINLIYKLDKNGCRENINIYYDKVDTILIGDSQLWGVAINNPFDITGRLRKNIPETTFLNLGVPGTSPQDQVLLIKKLAENTNFKNIVWFFFEANDFMISNSKNITCHYGSKDRLELKRKIKKSNIKFLSTKIFLAEHLRGLSSFIKMFINYENKFKLDENAYENTVIELNSFLNKKNIKKRILYYIPSYGRHALKNKIRHPHTKKVDELKSKVKKIATKHNFLFIDGDEAFNSIKNKLDLYHYRFPTHLNAKGTTLTADYLNNFLK